MLQIDEEIANVEKLYKQMAGTEAVRSETPYAPIPPEVDGEAFVQRNLERLRQAVQSLGVGTWTGATVPMTPRINVLENDKEWTCQVDLPGVNKTDIAVQLDQGVLRVSALRRTQNGHGQRPVYLEAAPCRYERNLPAPLFIKGETCEAKLENGLLNIRFQKDPASSRRDVSIQVA